jgi:serine/threonine protein kinase
MKLLLENWREYMKETTIYRRVVLNELRQLTERELKDFPLSKKEMDKIRDWAQLEGEPLFLGSGTMGNAYQFGDLVLKITKDRAEALAARAIEGQHHPNVYNVKKVIKRDLNDQTSSERLSKHPYLIVYDLVGEELGGPDLPTHYQQDIIKSMFSRLHNIFYNWPNNLDEIKNKFSNWVNKNSVLVEENQIPKFSSHKDKLDLLLTAADLNNQEKEALKKAWGVSIGFYKADNINSAEGILGALSDPGFEYVDEVSKGLTFLEKNGIRFRDLKTTNVMNNNGKLVIIDIGKSSVRNKSEIPTIGEYLGATN